jgi:hypothetical protein
MAVGLQGLVPLGGLPHCLGALDALVAGEVVDPDPAQLSRRDIAGTSVPDADACADRAAADSAAWS